MMKTNRSTLLIVSEKGIHSRPMRSLRLIRGRKSRHYSNSRSSHEVGKKRGTSPARKRNVGISPDAGSAIPRSVKRDLIVREVVTRTRVQSVTAV